MQLWSIAWRRFEFCVEPLSSNYSPARKALKRKKGSVLKSRRLVSICIFDLPSGWYKERRKTWFCLGGVVPIDSRRKGRELMNWIWNNEVYSRERLPLVLQSSLWKLGLVIMDYPSSRSISVHASLPYTEKEHSVSLRSTSCALPRSLYPVLASTA